jgi:hypothetical protein
MNHILSTWTALALLAAVSSCTPTTAPAAGWENADPAVADWFNLRAVRSCCGEGDAYEGDFFVDADGGLLVDVTPIEEKCHTLKGEFDDGGAYTNTTCRQAIPPGFKVKVPADKIMYAPPNPTGHGVIFLRQGNLEPICYFLPVLG